MDALAAAYASSEDEEPEHPSSARRKRQKSNESELTISPYFQPVYHQPYHANTNSSLFMEPPRKPPAQTHLADSSTAGAAVRYVSKRERANAILNSTQQQVSDQPSPVLESTVALEMPCDSKWQHQHPSANHLPKGLFKKLKGHSKAVNAIRWSPTQGSLLLSAGMDSVAHVWNVWSKNVQDCPVRTFCSHAAAIKDAQWSSDGSCILTCGFDQTSRLHDLETGCETQVFPEDQYVHVVKFHPLKKDVFLSGGSKGILRLWDVRIGGKAQEYYKGLGQVMDFDFNPEGKQLVAASDVAHKNVNDKAIVVWDFATQVPLSNQVYVEAYTCSCVRYHPKESVFIAQSNGNYIALFSGHPPFKLNKYKRFEGHQVSGYRIQCNFSPDGGLVVSGSSDGQVYIYQYRSTRVLKVLEAHTNVCTDVSYHPTMSSVVASAGWEGHLCIFK